MLNEDPTTLAPILEALKDGPLDTFKISKVTQIPYVALLARLKRLRDRGRIESLGRRRTFRHMGISYTMMWGLPRPRTEPGTPSPRLAGRITIGRGSRWWAGF